MSQIYCPLPQVASYSIHRSISVLSARQGCGPLQLCRDCWGRFMRGSGRVYASSAMRAAQTFSCSRISASSASPNVYACSLSHGMRSSSVRQTGSAKHCFTELEYKPLLFLARTTYPIRRTPTVRFEDHRTCRDTSVPAHSRYRRLLEQRGQSLARLPA